MSALTCSSLDAGYTKGRPVVRRFELTLEKGEVLALLGPNGAGKTTLLSTIVGLIPYLGGTVDVAGVRLGPGRSRAASKAGVVLVPDDRALFTGLTTRENLTLAARKRGTSIDVVLDYFPALRERL
jgi:branched-chain amino acid transport system ATP-binding protein